MLSAEMREDDSAASTSAPGDLLPHEAALIYPEMPAAEFQELVADIKKNGLLNPIVLHDGMILDGRHRYRACLQAGIEPKFREWEPNGSPASFVVSQNGRRRHLSESQRAMAAAKATEFEDLKRAASERERAGTLASTDARGRSAEKMAAIAGVSKASVERAARVIKNAPPEVVQAVESGTVSVRDAVAVVKLPADAQRAAVRAVANGAAPTLAKAVASQPDAPAEGGWEKHEAAPDLKKLADLIGRAVRARDDVARRFGQHALLESILSHLDNASKDAEKFKAVFKRACK